MSKLFGKIHKALLFSEIYSTQLFKLDSELYSEQDYLPCCGPVSNLVIFNA